MPMDVGRRNVSALRKTVVQLILIVFVATAIPVAQQLDTAQSSLTKASASAMYGRLPMTFEANRGQVDGQVNFLSRGQGYTALLTTGGMVLSLRPVSVLNLSNAQAPVGANLQFWLVGANSNPAAVGEDLQPGIVNYFIGNDPSQWHTNVPTYGRVRYENVYPGIDLVYYGSHQQLEYDFAVSPGADPRLIQFQIQGADGIQMDSNGDLILKTGTGELHFQSPIVYQESNGQRIPVSGGYVMKDATHVGFELGNYDASKPIVIDPVLVYSTYLGGSGTNVPGGIAVDSSGNLYVAGYTNSADFPLATLGSLPANTYHVFVAKLNASGSNLVYADYIGGNNQDYGIALVLDSANEVYVTGSTQSSNFPVVGAYQSEQPGPYSGFLTEVSASGSSLLYSTYLGGNTFDQPTGIAIDNLGEVYVAGYTMSLNFPVANAYQSTASANQGGLYGDYGFLTKFSANGSSLVYSTYLAGNSNVAQNCGSPCYPSPYSAISAVAVDANGNVYVTGETNTNNFPATPDTYLTSNTTELDANVGFVSKFSSAGALDYSTYFYGSSGNPVNTSAITVDASGDAYITGTVIADTTFPVTSTSICNPSVSGYACSYAFVTKFDPAATTLLYSTFLGANNFASPQAIALDSNEDAYILASTSSSAFATTNAIEAYDNEIDLLLVEIDPAASTQLFATYMGGSGEDEPAGMVLDASANIYIAGSTTSTDWPTTQGAFQTVPGGNTDAFIAKIGAASAPAVSLNPYTLQYSGLAVGTTSQAQTVLLRNLGSGALAISSIAVNGDFAQTDNCGSEVPAASSCTLSVTFTPTEAGTRSGTIVLQDNAAGSPHTINLSGVGNGPGATLTPTSLTFSGTALGTSTSAQTVTLANNGNESLSVSNIQITGAYSQTNNCPSTLAASSSCSINVVFTPTASGTQSGTLTVNDSAPGSPQMVNLTGTGADFSLSVSPSQTTINAGATATYTVTVAAVGGSFGNSVSLACSSGMPAQAMCSFSPSAPAPGATSASSTLTITTTSASAQAMPKSSREHPIFAFCMQMQGLGLLGMVLAGSGRGPKRLRAFILLALVILPMMFLAGCAGGTGVAPSGPGGGSGTTYTVTITGSSGTLQHSTTFSLTVQ